MEMEAEAILRIRNRSRRVYWAGLKPAPQGIPTLWVMSKPPQFWLIGMTVNGYENSTGVDRLSAPVRRLFRSPHGAAAYQHLRGGSIGSLAA